MEVNLTNDEIRLIEKSLISNINRSNKSRRHREKKGYDTCKIDKANEARKTILSKLTEIVPLDREYDPRN